MRTRTPEAPATRSRGARLTLALGLVLILLGLTVLGWVGWQYWGTTWVSERAQRDVVVELERGWERGATGSVETDHGLAEAIIRIPRFGDDYVMPVLEGVADEVLSAGFGHFEGSAGPGEVGNFALAAHRITHGEPLARMPELVPGDEVVVETRGSVFTYELTTGGDDLEVPFTETWVVAPTPVNPDPAGVGPAPGSGQALITLTTCAELFNTDDRLVAFGVLVDTQPRAAAS